MVNGNKTDIQTISELVENAGVFDSRGFSILKVTKNGKEEILQLPIKSSGVAEYQAELSQRAPRPPIKFEMIGKDSDAGRAAGLHKDTVCTVFDFTDEKYIDEMERHNDDFAWRVAVCALDVPLKKADGTPANSYEDKKRILQSNGITGNHLAKIYRDIQKLTLYTEERTDFLFDN